MRRQFDLSNRHDRILTEMKGKLDITLTATIERALEALEEKEAERNAKVAP